MREGDYAQPALMATNFPEVNNEDHWGNLRRAIDRSVEKEE